MHEVTSRRKTIALLTFSLALVLSVPLFNLREAPARAYAQRLVSHKNVDRLVRLLFNGDFLETGISRLLWRSGLSINPSRVLIGKQGWLYLGDAHDNNVSAHRFGESNDDVRMGQAMGQNLRAWDHWLRRHGVKGFVLVIGSDKHHVYRHHLPDWARLGRPPRVRSLLTSEAKSLIADPTPELIRRSANEAIHTYYRSDTHWNMWGAAISMASLRDTLEKQGVHLAWALPQPPAIERTGTRIGGDLAAFLRIQHSLTEQEPHPVLINREAVRTVVRELETQQVLAVGDFGQLQYPRHTIQTVTENASNDQKVLWLRDSFGIAQSPLMTAYFRESIQLHWGRALGDQAQLFVDLVRKQRPDLVVMTVVERVIPADLFLTPPPQD
ncbi:MAG: alginate O-acetyltransferase AlgX-related protein [Gammaproteobacteria bacterium]